MYLARFCYDVLPVNRQRAIDFIHREVEAARANRLNARMLVPLTRGHGEVSISLNACIQLLVSCDEPTPRLRNWSS